MDISEKNGQPSMEEILASIRRIIADEPSGPPQGIEVNPRLLSGQSYSSVDESSDFELPAIFRNGATQTPEKTSPLFGRLTDAIRGATAPTSELKPARTEEFHAMTPENGTNGRNGETHARQAPTLSSLRTARLDPFPAEPGHQESSHMESANGVPASPAPETTATASSGWKFGRAAPPPKAVEEEITRVMAPFKDTRFKQMAVSAEAETSSAAPSPAPVALHVAPAPEPAPIATPHATRPVDFSSIIPAHMDFPGIPNVEQIPIASPPYAPAEQVLPHHPWSAPDTIVPLPASPLIQGYVPSQQDEPYPTYRPGPPPPPVAHDGAPTGTIEDTTAELLRPMLRQWLADNMPRMVEKALHIEVAESVKTGKKPTIG